MRGYRPFHVQVGRWAGVALAAASVLFLTAPSIVIVVSSVSQSEYLSWPLGELSLRWYEKLAQQPEFLTGFYNSLVIAILATAVSTIFGSLAAVALVRWKSHIAEILLMLFMSPLVLPYVVTGVCLVVFFNLIGSFNSFLNLVIAHVVITLPYVIRTTGASLARLDPSIEEAAMNLGANDAITFIRITVPLIRPGIFAGALFSFVMSFDNFPVSVFLAAPQTQTLPIAIFGYIRFNIDPTVAALSTLLLAFSLCVALLIERFVGWDEFVGLK